MSYQQLQCQMIGVTLVMLLLAGCGAPAVTPVLEAPTATPVPRTPTPVPPTLEPPPTGYPALPPPTPRVATSYPILPTPTRSPILLTPTPRARGPEPEWLPGVFPKPGEVIALSEYNTLHRRLGAIPASSSVCIDVAAINLAEVGDFWECEDVISRTTVAVDGMQRAMRYRLAEPGSVCKGPLIEKRDAEGTPILSTGGATYLCFVAPLAAGIHQVDVSFEKSSGEMETFSWTFTLK